MVGTAIDMEMPDDLRVTVVAAGLDGRVEKATPRQTQTSRSDQADYRRMARQPAVSRQQAASAREKEKEKEQQKASRESRERRQKSQEMDDYLDIPAFLRRQAD